MEKKNTTLNTAVDLTIKIGVLVGLLAACLVILWPFFTILLWGIIIAIILYPLYAKLKGLLGGRRKLATLLITLVGLAVLLVPSYWLIDSLIEGIKGIAGTLSKESFEISPPSDKINEWPIIGHWLYSSWLEASENLGETFGNYIPQLTSFLEKVLNSLASTGIGIIQFAVSIIISGIFLSLSADASRSARKLFIKLVGERGEEFALVTEKTIRNVAIGVIGVALIQSILIGTALLIMDIPLAGLWTILVLILAIAQLPVSLVTIPVIIYLYSSMNPGPATLWAIYLLVAGLIDNVLKPIFMGKGASVPMLVIFLGAIGGFIVFGFLGLFLGAIILSLGYKLYMTWLET